MKFPLHPYYFEARGKPSTVFPRAWPVETEILLTQAFLSRRSYCLHVVFCHSSLIPLSRLRLSLSLTLSLSLASFLLAFCLSLSLALFRVLVPVLSLTRSLLCLCLSDASVMLASCRATLRRHVLLAPCRARALPSAVYSLPVERERPRCVLLAPCRARAQNSRNEHFPKP